MHNAVFGHTYLYHYLVILVHVTFFSSRCMLELKFAIYYRAALLTVIYKNAFDILIPFPMYIPHCMIVADFMVLMDLKNTSESMFMILT